MVEENKPVHQAGSNGESDVNLIHEKFISVSERYLGLVLIDELDTQFLQ